MHVELQMDLALLQRAMKAETEAALLRAALDAETARWEEALRLTWQMVDPLKPAGQPGSYWRGQDAGIVAALTTLRANLKTPNPSGKGRPLVDVPLTNVLGLVATHPGRSDNTQADRNAVGALKLSRPIGLRRVTMKAQPVKLVYGEGYVPCTVEEATHVTLNIPGPTGRLSLPVIQHGTRAGTGCWTWNGSTDAPTLRPSVLTQYDGADRQWRCHSWISDGAAQFLADCSHDMANSTVPLLEV